MNPEIKQKWIDALTSGKYKQCKGYLRANKDTFCATGVLCDILEPNNWSWYSIIQPYFFDWTNTFSVSRKIVEKAEIDFKTLRKIEELNDWMGCDFHTIAHVIEKEL